MPSQRKRIGFLPRPEVQNLIDQICKHNKLSQSKVTGILVEEALNSRGILKGSIKKNSFDSDFNKRESFLNADKSSYRETQNELDNQSFEDRDIKDEIQMINDFIEFKFFKKIMNNQNKNI